MQEAVSGISASADGAAVGIVVAKAIQMKPLVGFMLNQTSNS